VIRPADVTFVPATGGPAEIVAAEYHGPAWTYDLRLASGATIRSMRARSSPVAAGTLVRPSLVEGHHVVIVDGEPHDGEAKDDEPSDDEPEDEARPEDETAEPADADHQSA
jgi:hypothetical protein